MRDFSPPDKGEAKTVITLLHNSGNPYQAALFSALSGRYCMGPVRNVDHAMRRAAEGARLMHIHWDDRMFGRNPLFEANRTALHEFVRFVTQFRECGGRIIWTIHNKVPHTLRDPVTFEASRRWLAETADAIHVHGEAGGTYVVEELGADPSRVVPIPHPSYRGIYAAASFAKPRPPQEKRHFLGFGMMRHNKGLDFLAPAVERLSRRRNDWRMTVAGKSFSSSSGVLDRLAEAGVVIGHERVPNNEVAPLFNDADFFVAPFHNIFSSGSTQLALTFGLPVIAPALPSLCESLPPEAHELLYEPGKPGNLFRTLLAALEMEPGRYEEIRNACLAQAEALSPEQISLRYGELLDDVVASAHV